MPYSDEYLFVRFDKETFKLRPDIKDKLLNFYCNLWKFDPNFGEFAKCPICKKFFNQNQVVSQGIKTCSGNENNPHEISDLVEAWTPEMVWNDLLPHLEKGNDFFGAVAVVPQSGRIVGFVWGYLSDWNEISAKWNPQLSQKINSQLSPKKIAYFQEIGVDSNSCFRNKGIGTVLCRMMVRWMKSVSPNDPTFLHTHFNSPAVSLFKKSGYTIYEHIATGPNQGRIVMYAPSCKSLTPQNLINY